MSKELFVKDLKDKVGQRVQIGLAIEEIIERRTKNNQPFKIFTLRDRSGEVIGKVWSDYLPTVEHLKKGDVALFFGEVEEYQGTLNLKISSAQKLNEYDLSDYVVTARRQLSTLTEELKKRIDSVRNYQLHQLLKAFFEDEEFYPKFIQAPAAKRVHHAYQHGLLEHTLEVVTLLEPVFELYPHLNRDLAVTAALLHDIGKVYEYQITPSGNIERTPQGRLLGHIQIGARLIEKRLPKDFPPELSRHLLHIIYSHHATGEVKSEVVPSTPEAIAIAYVDHLSGDLAIAHHELNKFRHTTSPNSDSPLFTPFNRYLNTRLYLPPEEAG